MNELAIWVPAILTPTLTFAVVAIGIFQNNKRIEDMWDVLRAEMNVHHQEIVHMLTVLLGKVDELVGRVSRLEERRS